MKALKAIVYTPVLILLFILWFALYVLLMLLFILAAPFISLAKVFN